MSESGYLLDAVLARNIPCAGADFSEDSVTVVEKRLGGNTLFTVCSLCASCRPTSRTAL